MTTKNNRIHWPIHLALLVSALFCLSTTSKCMANTPPVEQAFDLRNVGSKTSIEVRVVEKNEYQLSLRLFIKKPNRFSHIFDKSIPTEERLTAEKKMGAPTLVSPGKWEESGAPITIKILVTKKPGDNQIANNTVINPKTSSIYMGRTADLIRLKLDPGHYTITTEYINGAPGIFEFPAELAFTKAHHGK